MLTPQNLKIWSHMDLVWVEPLVFGMSEAKQFKFGTQIDVVASIS